MTKLRMNGGIISQVFRAPRALVYVKDFGKEQRPKNRFMVLNAMDDSFYSHLAPIVLCHGFKSKTLAASYLDSIGAIELAPGEILEETEPLPVPIQTLNPIFTEWLGENGFAVTFGEAAIYGHPAKEGGPYKELFQHIFHQFANDKGMK